MKKLKLFVASFFITLLFLIKVSTIHAETIQINGSTIVTDGYITSTLQNNNLFYVGGDITSLQVNSSLEVDRNYLAEIDLTDSVVTDWNPQIDGPVHDIVLYNDTLFIGGQFKTFENQQRQYIVALKVDTKEVLNLNMLVDKPVYSLALDQNTLYLGGAYTEINGEIRNYLSSYNVEENMLTLWSPQIDNTVYDILIYEGKIYIGGSFEMVESQERKHLAAFNLVDGTLTDWDPSTELTITHIDTEDNQIAVTGFSLLGEEVIAKRLLIDPASGETIKEEEISIDAPVNTQLFQQEDPIESTTEGLMVDEEKLGFKIPSLADILTFAIRAFFAIAGLAALFFLLLGAFAWVTSGGDADAVGAAQQKIQAAVVGLLMMVVVLAIVWTLEQVIFNRRICLGLSCPITLPVLLEPSE